LAAAEAAGVGQACPGAKPTKPKPKPKPPPPLKRSGDLYIDYKMPDRFGLKGKGGLIEYHDDKQEIQPNEFRVNFTVRRLDGKPCRGTLALTVPRSTSFGVRKPNADDPAGTCPFFATYADEGVYTVRAKLDNTGFLETEELDGLLQFVVQDWLIVGLGDSNGSGEGAPDKTGSLFGNAKWQNEQCHRSALSYQAKTALAIEKDERTSVTFVHLACSGATILNGMLGEYEGIEPKKGPRLKSQIKEMDRLVGDREIDAVMISIGVNDLKFGKLVVHCIAWINCPKRNFAYAKPVRPLEQEMAALLKQLPGRYVAMGGELQAAGALPSRVYMSEYFDSTKDQNGNTCSPLIGVNRFQGFTQSEAQWAHDSVLLPLNREIQKTKKANGWNMIRGAYKRFRTHGLCAKPAKTQQWIIGLIESKYKQWNVEGTLHSSPEGNDAQAEYATNALRRGFYVNGRTRVPKG
jgi:lysophospholipase L1-like esterase